MQVIAFQPSRRMAERMHRAQPRFWNTMAPSMAASPCCIAPRGPGRPWWPLDVRPRLSQPIERDESAGGLMALDRKHSILCVKASMPVPGRECGGRLR